MMMQIVTIKATDPTMLTTAMIASFWTEMLLLVISEPPLGGEMSSPMLWSGMIRAGMVTEYRCCFFVLG